MSTAQQIQPKIIRLYILSGTLFSAIVMVNIFIFAQNLRGSQPVASLSKGASLVAPLPSSLLPIEQVKTLAAKAAPDTPITKIKLESKDKQFVYIVSLANNKQLIFDAQTGDKLPDATAHSEPAKGTLPQNFVPSIGFAVVQEIGLAQKPGGVISKIELSPANGQVVYSIHFTDGSLIDVAATDGAVVRSTEASESPSSSTEDPKSAAPATTETTIPGVTPSADSGTVEDSQTTVSPSSETSNQTETSTN